MGYESSRYPSPTPGVFWLAGLVFLVAGCFLILIIYLSVSGPSDVAQARSWEVDEAEVVDWMTQSAELEETFRREYAESPGRLDVYDTLEAAIGYQRKLKAIDPEDRFQASSRLDDLMKLLEETKGSALNAIVKGNSNEAANLAERGDVLSAMPLLEQALEYQQWINHQLKESDYVDHGEVARLEQRIASLQTVDAVAEVERIMTDGIQAYEVKDWGEAEALFERALNIQESINLNMPESPHVRWRLVQELKGYQQRIEAGKMNDRIEELLLSSPDLEDSDRLRMAMNLQGLLNEKYGVTEFANIERFESLKLAIASNESQAEGALLQQMEGALDRALRNQDWVSARRILLELESAIQSFQGRYSLVMLPNSDLSERIAWLIAKQSQLELFWELVRERLISKPGLGVQFFSTEVDQSLFEFVMGVNPSRWKGEGLPVDSVSSHEAREFCRRLEWALGQPVTLPRVDWLGFVTEVDLEGYGFWFSHNSGFTSKPVGSSNGVNGLYDLFGNLEEWVLDAEGDQILGLFGGCGADSTSKVRNEPLNRVATNFRSRWTGFRFCIANDS